jgi:hypothetical protein
MFLYIISLPRLKNAIDLNAGYSDDPSTLDPVELAKHAA